MTSCQSTVATFVSLTVLFSLLPISGCGPSLQVQYVAPEYKGLAEEEKSVLVLPYISKIVTRLDCTLMMDAKESTNRPVTMQEIELFETYVPLSLAEHTRARITQADRSFDSSFVRLRLSSLSAKEGVPMAVFLPSTGEMVYQGEKPDYVLLVQDLYFTRESAERRGTLGTGTRSDYSMDAGLEYVLWDNVRGRLSACGKLRKHLPLLAPPGKAEYLQVFDSFAASIVRESPLAVKRMYY